MASLRARGQQPACNVFPTPPGRERVRYVEPSSATAAPMMRPHARALAFVAGRIAARGGALLLFAVRLDDVDAPPALKPPVDKIVEPRGRKLPLFRGFVPTGLCASAVLQPSAISRIVWKAHEDRRFSLPPDDGRVCLVPRDDYWCLHSALRRSFLMITRGLTFVNPNSPSFPDTRTKRTPVPYTPLATLRGGVYVCACVTSRGCRRVSTYSNFVSCVRRVCALKSAGRRLFRSGPRLLPFQKPAPRHCG